MSGYSVAPGSGRALDCSRCAGSHPDAACSCLIHCGADGCTGQRRDDLTVKPVQGTWNIRTGKWE